MKLYETTQYTGTSSWNNPPSTLAGPSTQTFTTASTTPNLNVAWTGLASSLEADLQGGGGTYSVELVNNNETGISGMVRFAPNPTLSITYDHGPIAPTSISMSPQHWASDGHLYTSSATPSFSATTTDPDGDNVQYQVQVLSGSTVVASGTSASVTSGTAGTWADATALSDQTAYSYHVRAYDGTEYGDWSYTQPFTVETDTPAAPVVTCDGYPAGEWTATISGGTTCSWPAPLPWMNGYSLSLDGDPYWTSGTSQHFDPGLGWHTLTITPESAAGVVGSVATYQFGVGTVGGMLSPEDGSQTSTSVSLQAAGPPGYAQATFKYRTGTTGAFAPIPDHVVFDCGCPVTWPVSVTDTSDGVQTDLLTWYVTRTLADDGPVQIEAVFDNGSGGTITTPPVTVTLDRLGTGADYGTTQAGPATVGLQSGNAAISAMDVSIASYGSALSVTRTFNSVQPDKPGIFGPGWAASLTGGVTAPWIQLTDNGSYVVLAGTDGTEDSFTQGTTSGGITSYAPQGAAVTAGLVLTKNTSTSAFTLTDSSGTATTFAQAATGGEYLPQTITQQGGAELHRDRLRHHQRRRHLRRPAAGGRPRRGILPAVHDRVPVPGVRIDVDVGLPRAEARLQRVRERHRDRLRLLRQLRDVPRRPGRGLWL